MDNIGVKPRPYARAVFSTSPGGKKQRHEGGHAAERTLSKATGKKFESERHFRLLQGRPQIPPRVHLLLAKG